MNALSSLYSADRLIREIAPAMPPEVQQVADQLAAQTGPLLADAYYGLLAACITAAIALLFSSLLLVLNHPSPKPVQPKPRLIRSAAVHPLRQPKRPVENRVATANRAELRLVSDRLRAGQLSN